MHYTKVKGILSQNNGMNLYRGCTHGCIYCDSRSNCYQMNHEFEDIEVKENAIELLENTLRRKRKRCMIGTGSMSDPYMPLEAQLEYTRKALLLIEKYGFGATLITKSDRVLRDLDILKRINQKTKAVVQITLTTADDTLCRIIEPNVCPTSRRFEVLTIFQKKGIPTVVWLAPILPFINDSEENLRSIVEQCASAGVKGIICFGFGLTLREGNREYFYNALDQHFPGLRSRYKKQFGNSYECNSPHNKHLMQIFTAGCKKYGIMCCPDNCFAYLHDFPCKDSQLSLF